jgi:digeranylgeranylglycerophospholipid reductase
VREKYDVIIAGLGPAGTVALWHLARKGFNVAAIDWRNLNTLWGKPCGDALGAHHPREAGLPEPPSTVIKNHVKAIDIYSPGETTRYRVHGEGYIINRNAFGKWLVESVIDKDNVDVFFNSKVLEPIIKDNKVVGVRAKIADKVAELRSSIVIEATGFSRVLRNKLPREWPIYEPIDPRDTNIAYREVIEYEDYKIDEPDVIRIYLDQEIAPGGYWWYFPESTKSVNVGLGVQGGMGYPNPMTIYKEKLTKHPLLQKKYHVHNAAGAPLPTRRPSNTLVGPGIVAIGDAGYTVNPVHGGGMGYAFRAAYYAAQAIEEAYNRNDFSEEGLWSLNTNYMQNVGAKQAALDVFRRFLQRLPNDDIRYGMEKKLLPEEDVLYTSNVGELRISTLEKAKIIIRGLGRPSLLAKLKLVGDYMKKARDHYMNYPESPAQLSEWIKETERIFNEFEQKLAEKM